MENTKSYNVATDRKFVRQKSIKPTYFVLSILNLLGILNRYVNNVIRVREK